MISIGGEKAKPASPRLLVSVRTPIEAERAIRGGADIVDVKDPAQGALGMASPAALAGVARILEASERYGSCALGELAEWEQRTDFDLPASYVWCKLGLAGCGGRLDWRALWNRVRTGVESQGTVRDWIAVVYADWQQAEAPAPDSLLDFAATEGCAGILLDTWSKTGPGTLDLWSLDRLIQFRMDCHAGNLPFALAGRIDEQQLEQVSIIAPDIVGFRSAACRKFNREGEVDENLVSRISKRLGSVPA